MDEELSQLEQGVHEDNNIDWNIKGYRSFSESFINVLQHCSLTNRSKLIIKERFINMYERYFYKYKYTKLFFYNSRVIITIFSLVVPALLTIANEMITDDPELARNVGYIAFSMSLVISILNMMLEVFQLNKKFFTYAITKENLKTEGWLFLSLTGKYHNFTNHSECWRTFINRIEKLNVYAVNTKLILSKSGSGESNKNPIKNIPWDFGIQPLEVDNKAGGEEKIEEEKVIYVNH